MYYTDLQQLIQQSSSTRRYFLSLPVPVQTGLHERNATIHTAQQLHRAVRELAVYEHQCANSDYFRL